MEQPEVTKLVAGSAGPALNAAVRVKRQMVAGSSSRTRKRSLSATR